MIDLSEGFESWFKDHALPAEYDDLDEYLRVSLKSSMGSAFEAGWREAGYFEYRPEKIEPQ